MSLILEALKKSEAQRRLGEAPSLGTPFTATRRRRGPLPWITLGVVLVAAGAGWWLLRPHTRLAETAAPTPAPVNDARAAADAKARIQPAPSANVPAQRPAEAHAPPIAVIAPPGPQAAATQHNAPPVAGATTPVAPNHALWAPPLAVAVEPPRPVPTAPKTAEPKDTAKSEAARAPPPAAAATPNASAPAPVPAQASAPGSAEPAIPTVDDLAFDLRRDLPDLPITMQVYSNDPTRRFILVDGERKKEGDSIRDVAVREIRSNGVVLEFRGQRFLLPRPGS